ncbi:MAG: glycosyltransferase family 2 protein [Planctomycetota bacterium]|jgi:undecaprenyl-phosphate 4-deoxy-4-formamido-L-arabinose transferase
MDRENMGSQSVSVVVPVYNSELTLSELVDRLGIVLPRLTDEYELILVNDGSHDQSWRLVRQLAENHSWVHGIDLMRNYGQHSALLVGIREARNDVVVTLDDDLQNPPEEIPLLLQKLNEGYDVVYGSPQKMRQSVWRNIASVFTKLALKSAMGIDTARQVSAFRAFRTILRNAFESYHGGYVSIDVLLTWATIQFGAVKVKHSPRDKGVSNYTFWKLVTHAINMLTGFSSLPLQLASFMGFAFTLFGVAVLIYVVGRYVIHGGSVPGFPFLASVIAIFAGVQLFAIGIIGMYLARMHFRLMGRPPYSVRTVVGKPRIRATTSTSGPDAEKTGPEADSEIDANEDA